MREAAGGDSASKGACRDQGSGFRPTLKQTLQNVIRLLLLLMHAFVFFTVWLRGERRLLDVLFGRRDSLGGAVGVVCGDRDVATKSEMAEKTRISHGEKSQNDCPSPDDGFAGVVWHFLMIPAEKASLMRRAERWRAPLPHSPPPTSTLYNHGTRWGMGIRDFEEEKKGRGSGRSARC